jgi:hypothetical protein
MVLQGGGDEVAASLEGCRIGKTAGKFLNTGNVTMVSVVLENSQNQRAVKLQRFMNYEM